MFDAIFTASSGQSFSFGYKAGVLYSIDPIGDLPVELETSQGYQQVGATVESRSISGVTRTITGRILRNTAYLKRQLRDIFTPGATGRLTVAGKYYCDAEVQRCPAISAANLWPTFSFQLYCPNPYWRSVSETSVSLFYTQPAFRLPVCYSTHQFGLRIQSDFLKLSNPGPDTQDFVLTLTAQGVVRTPACGILLPESIFVFSPRCRTATSFGSGGRTGGCASSRSSTARPSTPSSCWMRAAPSGRCVTAHGHGHALPTAA